MTKKIIILNGSPKKDGNTAALIGWFCEGARTKGAEIDVVDTAFLKYKASGCTSCRKCQKLEKYECVINDDAKPVLARMPLADVIVLATPLYFLGPSAQIKLVIDRMFSLYKWNNKAGTMETPLRGKPLVLIASAFEEEGLDLVEKTFAMLAKYTDMPFSSLIVPGAGESGNVSKLLGIREKAIAFGKQMA
jgi:multimeric flavodoxin WrbA